MPDYPVTVFFTREGYLKKIPPQSLRTAGAHKLKEGDEIVQQVETRNNVEALFFTDKQQVYKVRLAELEDGKVAQMGIYLPGRLGMDEGESILDMVITSDYGGYMLFFFASGKCAKIPLSSYATKQNRRKLLKALGANLVLTEGAKGMKGAIQKAEEIVASNPEKYLLLQQFSNPANPEIHEKTTGPEIWEDTDGQVDVFIAGVGTGGTLTGVSRYIKGTKGKTDLISVAVEPTDSPVIAQALAGEEIKPGPHKIQGIGAGFIPANLDLKLVDKVIGITNEEAISTARRLMEEEGILAGISSGAAVAAALKLQEDESFTNKNIVVILPSSGERYLSTALFADLFTEKELQQ